MIDFEKFKRDLDAAQSAAMNYATIPDEGTCNFDSVYVKLGRDSKGLRDGMKKIGVSIYKVYTDWFYVRVNAYGQGYRRTKMVETVSEKLNELGWESHVHYAMD